MLTGGGDCPGLNAVIRAIVRKGERVHGDELIGFLDAWDGVRARHTMPLTVESMRGTLPRGGTVLGTRRGSPFDTPGGAEDVGRRSARPGHRRTDRHRRQRLAHRSPAGCTPSCGLPIVGVPKTIDNDIVGTDSTFGFHTAVQIATDAIDRLHTTAESHDRVMVVEVMGRHTGWIATYAGIAGGATAVADPRDPVRHRRGLRAASRAATSAAGTPRSSSSPRAPSRYRARSRPARSCTTSSATCASAAWPIRSPARSATAPGFETRVVMLGHIQRGGTPTAFDRVLSTRFGVGRDRRRARRRLGSDGRAPRPRDRAGAAELMPSARPAPST